MLSLPSALQPIEQTLRSLRQVEAAERLRVLRKAFDLPELRVAVFGEFSRGKSTLINALLGRVVLPAKLVPTTGHVTWLAAGPDEVRVRYADGRAEVCPLTRLEQLTGLDGDGRAREDVAAVVVAADAPLLRRCCVAAWCCWTRRASTTPSARPPGRAAPWPRPTWCC
jgi:hypothetical protein